MTKLRESKEDIRKFTDWIINSKSRYEDISKEEASDYARTLVDRFLDMKSRLKSPYNDLYYWIKLNDVDELEDYLHKLDLHIKSKKDTEQKEKDGARLVYSDKDWKVYEITTYEASVKYGKNTKWCITGSKRWADRGEGRDFWDGYYSKEGVKFYFFIRSNDEKYALAIYPGDKYCEIYNSEDINVPFIPNAPEVDEIKVDYTNHSSKNILVNAIMNRKIPEQYLFQVFEEVIYDNTGNNIQIYNRASFKDFVSDVADLIPNGYIEHGSVANGDLSEEEYERITGEKYTDYWGGDISPLEDLFAYQGNTKEEVLKTISDNENAFEYFMICNEYDGTYLAFVSDYLELCQRLISESNVSSWTDFDVDEFFAEEEVGGTRGSIFFIMCANQLIADIKNGTISKDVLNNIPDLPKDFLNGFKESFDNLFNEDTKVSRIVKNEDKKLYHGSVEEINGELNSPINWITHDYNYAKTFALENGYVYTCEASLDNLFDVGKTDARVYDLLPIKPYRLSREFEAIVRKLNLNENVVKKLLENVISEYKLEANGYKLMIRPVVRSVAFKRILESLGYKGLKAIEYDSVNNKDVETFGLFDHVKIVDREKIDESLNESRKAITWGDLDYAKKTDTRGIMMNGRGTGHFGTGFYFVGKDGPYGLDANGNIKGYDYEPGRPIYEIDLDAYKLFKPSDNDMAYRIHDAMREINNGYEPSLNAWIGKNFDIDKLEDELFNLGWNLSDIDEDIDDDLDFDDLEDMSQDTDLDDEDTKPTEDEQASTEKYRKLIKDFIAKYGLEDYVWGDLDNARPGELEDIVKKAIYYKYDAIKGLEYALRLLSKVFGVSEQELLDIITKAYSNTSSKDTISTQIFKAMGYEGVDVTHLNHDAQGLSGLDNFSYGTVIYDLKPGTFKKIKEPRETKSKHYKSNEQLKEYFDTLDGDFPIYVTDEVYRVKSMLERSDKPYRIYHDNIAYYLQDARGDKTHYEMLSKALENGLIDPSSNIVYPNVNGGYEVGIDDDDGYMVFIPKGFHGSLRYFTSLGQDSYYNCRVYPYGVMFVRNYDAYYNSLFDALGEPEREVEYDSWEDMVYLTINGQTKELELDDLNGDPNNAINLDIKDTKQDEVKTIKDNLQEGMRGTSALTNERVKKYFDECVEEMKKLSFTPGDKDFLTYDDITLEEGDTIRTFGVMSLPKAYNDNFTMTLNKHMFEESEEAIKNTIYHELCHYVVDKIAIDQGIFYEKYPGSWYIDSHIWGAKDYKGHGKIWKYVAAKVGNAVGQNIQRTDSYETHTGVGAHANDSYKYIVKCKHCGREFKYTRMSSFIKDIFSGDGHASSWYCICDDGTKSHDFEIVKGK